MPDAILAMYDMRDNLIAAGVLLVMGVVIMGLLRRPTASREGRRWLPIVALISGPVVAFLWFLADLIWISPGTNISRAECYETFIRVMAIGVAGGVIGAIAFWMGDRIWRRRAE